jgi:hypothetical protein
MPISVSECVVPRLMLPGVVVTWIVPVFPDPRKSGGSYLAPLELHSRPRHATQTISIWRAASYCRRLGLRPVMHDVRVISIGILTG